MVYAKISNIENNLKYADIIICKTVIYLTRNLTWEEFSEQALQRQCEQDGLKRKPWKDRIWSCLRKKTLSLVTQNLGFYCFKYSKLN